ncbi:MAPEG family protein [Sphingomonas mucosissima]|uniref:MAPEG family protein n=1 Tax=Sphingomonas mucosissima TaxID=370959 RepID=A0A245ZQV0_9SPHN|nr:MAPEG family protein [Sphingomonas mucosissima]OWK32124.1 MAPEG family protein [Sphingomonas mucosissima]
MAVIELLWPTFALVALVFVVWFTLFVQRIRHMRHSPPRPADFADGEAARRYFLPVEMPANNLANLFEMPVLYFALVPLLILTGQANYVQVTLAWLFVFSRSIHSFIHIGPKKVQWRFLAYLVSVAFLMAMWVGFLIDMASVAREQHRVMVALGGVL